MSELIAANDTNFSTLINDQKAIIVDFWAPTCAPCISMEPNLARIASSYGKKVKVLKVNVNECPRTSSRYLVRGLPTLLFMKDGNVKSQIVGAVQPSMIEQRLREVM